MATDQTTDEILQDCRICGKTQTAYRTQKTVYHSTPMCGICADTWGARIKNRKAPRYLVKITMGQRSAWIGRDNRNLVPRDRAVNRHAKVAKRNGERWMYWLKELSDDFSFEIVPDIKPRCDNDDQPGR